MVRLSAGEKKKRLIIGVCKKLFYRNGYVGTTYEDICREADIPPGTITYHFDGKAGIATAIEVEYEAQNKIYIEKMCGDLFSKTQLAVIENYHMWKRIYEDGNTGASSGRSRASASRRSRYTMSSSTTTSA